MKDSGVETVTVAMCMAFRPSVQAFLVFLPKKEALMSSNFIMTDKEMIQDWDSDMIGVYMRVKCWEAYGTFEKKWAGRKLSMTPGKCVFTLEAMAISLKLTVKVVRRVLDQLVECGALLKTAIGVGARKEGTMVTCLDTQKRAHEKAHGPTDEDLEAQGFPAVPEFEGHTEGHGLEDRSKEERILTPPRYPPAGLGVGLSDSVQSAPLKGEEENVMATPLLQEPTAQEIEMIKLGEAAIGVRATERTSQKFIREYRASGHLMSADDIRAAFGVIASHPHLKASTKAITRVFHMKAVRAAARDFDTRQHNDILDACRRTGDIDRAKSLYRAAFRKPEDAEVLILHYAEEFEAYYRLEAFG